MSAALQLHLEDELVLALVAEKVLLFDHRCVTLAKGPSAASLILLAVCTGCPVDEKPARPSLEIEPAEGLAGTEVKVNVRGRNTHFDAEKLDVSFEGGGVTLEETLIDGPTAARLRLSIAETATAGPRKVTLTTGGMRFEQSFQVLVIARTASVEMDPKVGTPTLGQELVVHLDGTRTHFESGATTLAFPESAGIQVLGLAVASATEAVATLRIQQTAPGGPVAGVVSTRDEVVYAPFEVLTEVLPSVRTEPAEAFAGQELEVTITGSNTDFDIEDGVRVEFLPTPSRIEVTDVEVDSKLLLRARFQVPAEEPQGFKRLRVVYRADGEEEVATGPFFVRSPGAPAVTILPNAVVQGTEETFLWATGRGTSFDDSVSVAASPSSGLEVVEWW